MGGSGSVRQGPHSRAQLGACVRQMLVLSLNCPFCSAQGPSPWDSAAHAEGGFSRLAQLRSETSSQTSSEAFPLGLSRSCQVGSQYSS